jgi:hypothetical protein
MINNSTGFINKKYRLVLGIDVGGRPLIYNRKGRGQSIETQGIPCFIMRLV